jgi:hypothetical protein
MMYVTLLSALFSSQAYAQNAVTDWAAIVQPPLNTPARLPAIQNILRAMVHIAIYDAVVAIEGGYQPFAAVISDPGGSDVRAAVATAAYLTARARVVASQIPVLDAAYTTYLATIPDGPAKTNGISVGEQAASAILALRANDGMTNTVLYVCSSNPPLAGQFEPDGGCNTQPAGVNVGQIRPFTFAYSDQFRPGGPDPLTSIAYTEDFIETRDFGRCDSNVRTRDETSTAYFWQTVNIHEGLINLAIDRGLSSDVRQTARLFALVYTAAADANIAGFEAKYFYAAWRPRTAIPRADTDGNEDTFADPGWKPLISVNHPEYPSAHTYSSTAMTDSIARFFGTNRVTWRLRGGILGPTVAPDCTPAIPTIPQLVQTERTYDDLNRVMREIYDARVWAGLHWRHSMMNGAQVGRKIAQHVWTNFFQPVP